MMNSVRTTSLLLTILVLQISGGSIIKSKLAIVTPITTKTASTTSRTAVVTPYSSTEPVTKLTSATRSTASLTTQKSTAEPASATSLMTGLTFRKSSAAPKTKPNATSTSMTSLRTQKLSAPPLTKLSSPPSSATSTTTPRYTTASTNVTHNRHEQGASRSLSSWIIAVLVFVIAVLAMASFTITFIIKRTKQNVKPDFNTAQPSYQAANITSTLNIAES